MDKQLLYVLIGGGLGSMGRYLIAEIVPSHAGFHFPWGTFTANILGCLIIGALTALLSPSGDLDSFFVTGFCGGFTTFSSFSKETFQFIENKKTKVALLYVSSSAVFGILAVLIGYIAGGGNFK